MSDIHASGGAPARLLGADALINFVAALVAVVVAETIGKVTTPLGGTKMVLFPLVWSVPIGAGFSLVHGALPGQSGRMVVGRYTKPCETDRQLGGEPELAKIRKGVGMVFPQFNLFPHKTVLETIAIAPIQAPLTRKPKKGP